MDASACEASVISSRKRQDAKDVMLSEVSLAPSNPPKLDPEVLVSTKGKSPNSGPPPNRASMQDIHGNVLSRETCMTEHCGERTRTKEIPQNMHKRRRWGLNEADAPDRLDRSS